MTNASGTFTSTVLETGNGTPHSVEGFMGATSLDGITSVVIEGLDGSGHPASTVFEVDHL